MKQNWRMEAVKKAFKAAEIKYRTASSKAHFIVPISKEFSLSVQCSDYLFDYDALQSLRGSKKIDPASQRLTAQRSKYIAETALFSGKELVYDKTLGYDDVRKWISISQLVKHILTLRHRTN